MRLLTLIFALTLSSAPFFGFAQQKTPKTIKVMSYNIRYAYGMDEKYDIERTAEVIKRQKPDIVGLQEIGDSTMAAKLGELTGMAYVFGPSQESMKKYGDAVLCRFPFEWVGNYSIPSASSSRYQVMGIDVDLSEIYGEGSKVRFLNTHFDWLRSIGSQEARLATVDVIERGFFGDNRLPTILTGDLNAEPDSPPLKKLMKNGWVNKKGGKELFTIPVVNPDRQIDYVLVRPEKSWNIVSVEVIQERVASDHLPVVMVLELEQEKLHWWGDIDGFINQQHKTTLDLVEELLKKYPPDLNEPLERRTAMLMIDGVLHEEKAAHRPAVQAYLRSRIQVAAEEIEQAIISEGAKIWKLYNHGFVIRTASVTFGFDLVRAHSARAEGFSVEDTVMERIIDQCDALFVSHRHRDHADMWVAQTFLDQEKPVVAPPEVWKDQPIHQEINHLKREPRVVQVLSIQNGSEELKVIVNPGRQGRDIENNVPLVITPEGLSFAQTGDQSGPNEDWIWIDEMNEYHEVDVLLPNCWTPDVHRMIKGFKPKLVITGHENEMGHTIDHRESNWLTYTRLKGAKAPYLLLSWGESFHYRR